MTGCSAWAQHSGNPNVEALENRVEAQRKLLWDWGGLNRYGSEDSELPLPTAGENRVVFLGDDITQAWDTDFFNGKPYLNQIGRAHV